MGVRVPSGVPIKDAVDDTIHCVFYLCIGIGTRMIKSQYAGGILLQPVQKTGCYLNFCPSPARAKMQTSPFRYVYSTGMNSAPQFMRPYRNTNAYFNIIRFHRKRRTIPQSTDDRGNRRTVPPKRRTIPIQPFQLLVVLHERCRLTMG